MTDIGKAFDTFIAESFNERNRDRTLSLTQRQFAWLAFCAGARATLDQVKSGIVASRSSQQTGNHEMETD